eukprot:gene3888-7760_t
MLSRKLLCRNFKISKIFNNNCWGSVWLKFSSSIDVSGRKAGPKTSRYPTSTYAHETPKSDGTQLGKNVAIGTQIYDTITNLIEVADQNGLWQYIDTNLSNLTIKHISQLLFYSTKHSMQVPSIYLFKIANILASTNQFISVLADRLQDPNTTFNAKQFEFASAFFGLQFMSGDSQEVRQLLSALSHKLEVNSSNVELTDKSVCMILYGLQGMSAQYEEVRNLLQIFTLKVQCSSIQFESQSLGMALHALQGMNSEFEEVRLLMKLLNDKVIDKTGEVVDQRAAGNALFDMSNLEEKILHIKLLFAVFLDSMNRFYTKSSCSFLSANFTLSFVAMWYNFRWGLSLFPLALLSYTRRKFYFPLISHLDQWLPFWKNFLFFREGAKSPLESLIDYSLVLCAALPLWQGAELTELFLQFLLWLLILFCCKLIPALPFCPIFVHPVPYPD